MEVGASLIHTGAIQLLGEILRMLFLFFIFFLVLQILEMDPEEAQKYLKEVGTQR